MTRKLQETLNLPDLEDILKEQSGPDPELEKFAERLDAAERATAMVDGRDHAEGCDTIFKETLDHSRALMDLGYNIDVARAPRIFKAAAEMYKVALDAKNAKRDAELKRLKLAMDQKLVELKEQEVTGKTQTLDDSTLIIDDRNELIKSILEKQTKD